MEPIRVAETTVAAYAWDAWVASAEAAARRARRVTLVVAVVVPLALAAGGWALLRPEARFSILIYAPVAGIAVWYGLRDVLTRWWLADPLRQVRDLVVPALVERLDTTPLVNLISNGGALDIASSTVLAVQRREGLVAVVASQYDPNELPASPIGNAGSSGP